jgi:hypothetical protein
MVDVKKEDGIGSRPPVSAQRFTAKIFASREVIFHICLYNSFSLGTKLTGSRKRWCVGSFFGLFAIDFLQLLYDLKIYC